MTLKLDYTLQDPKERVELVKKITEETPPEKLTPRLLEILSDYIIFAMDKQERKQNKILTDNHMVTVHKRETSYQGLVSKFENGEDGVSNLITNDKNIIFQPKDPITQADIDSIPPLAELVEEIARVEMRYAASSGKARGLLFKQLKEMRQEQYTIRNEFRNIMYSRGCGNGIKGFSKINLEDHFSFDECGDPVNDGMISLFNPEHVSALLCNYSKIKEDCWDALQSDSRYLMMDLDNAISAALTERPMYERLVLYKIDGKQNIEIQELLYEEFGIKHSVEYISCLWRKKIPKLIAEKEKENYLIWYYTYVERGKWKRCSRCGEIKLAHNRFFSKNKTSKDGFYSICKCCRNGKV